MRIIPFVVSIFLTVALIYMLDNKWGQVPPLGKFLSPQQGFWQNAEPVHADLSEEIVLPVLNGTVRVYVDDRLVPHVFAEDEADAYFVQGYLHAKYRLWQMEFQTMAAAGRISEIIGYHPRALRFDREQRRLGMVYAAENAVRKMESDAQSKKYYDAYTAGVNAYISNLSESELPVEYKLLDYRPEPWSNLKVALFLKMMTKDLAGFDRDLEFTNQRSVFSHEEMRLLYPQLADSSIPIIPAATVFDSGGRLALQPPPTADSLYFLRDTLLDVREMFRPDPNNGSNSWALSGSRTYSGAPILCNDPHLGLSLPSIWFEMQLTTPTMNVYGATFPGAPSVIIGFNDHVAFGFTNAQRDVKDYYQLRFRDATKSEYWFNGRWQTADLRVEKIRIRGSADYYDTVAYSVFGPVMYDQDFGPSDTTATASAIALRWVAHDPSDEGSMWFRLNRAQNYNDYLEAIKGFSCPGQNMLFASKSGDIAIWQQARFPARWQGQGLYVMPGEDSSYMWQGFIPQEQNPHVLNPASGFIQSANQRPVDSTYPYFIPGNYIAARGVTIASRLQQLQHAGPSEMMRLQLDYYSSTASMILPFMISNTDVGALGATEREFLDELRRWDFMTTPDSRSTTLYQAWLDSLESRIWMDEFSQLTGPVALPEEQTLVEALLRDSAFRFVDDVRTEQKETVQQQVTAAFRQMASAFSGSDEVPPWAKFKNVSIMHLTGQLEPFSRRGLYAGGWGNTPNAIKVTHGPSWRMIVHLNDTTEAYGVYPGGQSGNPGSPFYDNGIDMWLAGRYYVLWMMKPGEATDKRIRGTITFKKA